MFDQLNVLGRVLILRLTSRPSVESMMVMLQAETTPKSPEWGRALMLRILADMSMTELRVVLENILKVSGYVGYLDNRGSGARSSRDGMDSFEKGRLL